MRTSLLEKIIKHRKNSTAENIIICIATALAGTFYFYEYYYDRKLHIHSLLCILISAVIAVTWIVCSLLSGKDKKMGFAVFAFLYWSIPYIYILFYSSQSSGGAHVSKWLTFLDKIAKALFYNPFYEVAKKTGASSGALAGTLLILVMAAYICGYILSVRYEKSQNISLENYDGEYEADEDDGLYDEDTEDRDEDKDKDEDDLYEE